MDRDRNVMRTGENEKICVAISGEGQSCGESPSVNTRLETVQRETNNTALRLGRCANGAVTETKLSTVDFICEIVRGNRSMINHPHALQPHITHLHSHLSNHNGQQNADRELDTDPNSKPPPTDMTCF